MLNMDALFPNSGMMDVEADEAKTIESFSETKGNKVTPGELTEAEDKIQENEEQDREDDKQYREEHSPEEESTDDLSAGIDTGDELGGTDTESDESELPDDAALTEMSYYQLQCTRFLPKSLDAADAAIIDNAIEPAEATEEEGGSWEGGGGGDTGGFDEFGAGGDEDMGDFSFRSDLLKNEEYIPGTENILTTAGYTAIAIVRMARKLIKYGTRGLRFAIRKAEHCFVSTEKLGKLYEFKLSKMMTAVDDDVLESTKVDAFPYDTWMALAKSIKPLTDGCFSDDLSPKAIDSARSNLAKFGIQLQEGAEKVSYSKLLDKRTTKSVVELGYTKENVVNCFRYMQIIGELTNKKARAKTISVEKKIFAQVSSFKEKVAELAKDKDGNEAKITASMGATQQMYTYKIQEIEAGYALCNKLVSDLLVIGKVYEDAIMPKYIR